MPDIMCPNCSTIYDPSATGGKCPACGTGAPLPPRVAGAGFVAAPKKAAPRTGMPPRFPRMAAAGKSISNAATGLGGGIAETFAKGGSKAIAKYIRGRYVTVTLLIVAGVFLMSVGTPAIPALGLPSIKATFIGVALILYAFYYMMPSHHQIMADIQHGSNWICPYTLQTDAYGRVLCNKDEFPGEKKLSNPPKCHGEGRNHPEVSMNPKRTWMELETSHYGWLYGRSFMKILAISFAALEFSPLAADTFPFKHILIPIIFLFWAYFSMPTGYKKSEPYKAAEAWFRMILGITLAALVMTFLTPNPDATFTSSFWIQFVILFIFAVAFAFIAIIAEELTKTAWLVYLLLLIIMAVLMPVLSVTSPVVYGVPGVSVFFLILAFFATFPERRTKEPTEGEEEVVEEEEARIKPGLAKNMSDAFEKYREKTNIVGNMIFVSLALFGGVPVLTWAGGGVSLQIAYGLVWIMSILMGIVSGRESRPYLGVIVMILTIISFSFAFSSTLGSAVFGTYWGTVQHTGEVFFGPMSESMNKASCDAYANYQCITVGPIECKNQKLLCQRKQGEAEGSDRSIDVVEFVASPKEIGYDASHHIPNTTVYVTIENTGDYEAQNVRLKILGKEDNFPNVTYIQTKEIFQQIGNTYLQSCLGGNEVTGERNTCEWEGAFKKGSRGVVNFVIDWDKGQGHEDFPPECGTGTKDCVWKYYYGQYPKIGINIDFDYEVTSSYDASVRSSAEMTKLLQEGTDIAGSISKYTGGPIISSLWTPKYLESGKASFVSAALTNNKEGKATKASYCIYVPTWAGTPSYSSGTGKQVIDAHDCDPMEGTNVIECYWENINSVTNYDANMKPKNSGECTFTILPDTEGAPQKQLVLTGKAKFHYEIPIIRKDIPIVG